MTWVAVSHKNEKATLLKCFGSRGLCWKFTPYNWKLELFKLHRILCRILHRILCRTLHRILCRILHRILCRILHRILNRIIYKILHSFICECIGFLDINHCQARENSNKWAWQNKGAGWNFYPKLINEQVLNKGKQGGQVRKK